MTMPASAGAITTVRKRNALISVFLSGDGSMAAWRFSADSRRGPSVPLSHQSEWQGRWITMGQTGDAMDEREIGEQVGRVARGAMSRRAFLRAMTAAGLTLPMAGTLL